MFLINAILSISACFCLLGWAIYNFEWWLECGPCSACRIMPVKRSNKIVTYGYDTYTSYYCDICYELKSLQRLKKITLRKRESNKYLKNAFKEIKQLKQELDTDLHH